MCIRDSVYGYPKEEAVPIALDMVIKWLEENKDYNMEVTFMCFNDEIYRLFMTMNLGGRSGRRGQGK